MRNRALQQKRNNEIIKLYNEGHKVEEIAAKYFLQVRTVEMIVSGQIKYKPIKGL